MTPKSAPLYHLLQRLRDGFYGLELHLERTVPIRNTDGIWFDFPTDQPTSVIVAKGLHPEQVGEPYWLLMVNGESVAVRWEWLPEHDKTKDPDGAFVSRWVGLIGERAAQNAVERIERIKAGYARET